MIKTWAVTDTGLVRKENQDTYRIARNGDICVVCDGMGGAAGGRLASTLASETYAAEMEKALKPDMTPEQLREASAYAVAMPIGPWQSGQRRRRRLPIWVPLWLPLWPMRTAW